MEAWNGKVWVLDGGLHTENEFRVCRYFRWVRYTFGTQ